MNTAARMPQATPGPAPVGWKRLVINDPPKKATADPAEVRCPAVERQHKSSASGGSRPVLDDQPGIGVKRKIGDVVGH